LLSQTLEKLRLKKIIEGSNGKYNVFWRPENEVRPFVGMRESRKKSVGILSRTLGAVLLLAFFSACNSTEIEESDGRLLARKHGCFGCHGMNGNSENPAFPNLAGQKVIYLKKQLAAFRRFEEPSAKMDLIRKRYNGMMSRKAAELSAEEADRLAEYFAAQTCAFGKHRKQPPVPVKAKACFKCHGEQGVGSYAEVPKIAGQNRDYLTTQLFAFRNAGFGATVGEGEKSRFHHLMTPKASLLSDDDIAVLSHFFSRLDCRGAEKVEN